MAIAKRPPSKPTDPDQASENFIAQAGKAPAPDTGKTSVIFRFRNVFLDRVDAAAARHELSRQAWVRTVVAAALEQEGL